MKESCLQACRAQQQQLGRGPTAQTSSCQHCGSGFVEQYSSPVFFTAGSQRSPAQCLPQLMPAGDQLSTLGFPLPCADFTAAGFHHSVRISQPSLQLPLLKLPERCCSAPSLSALPRAKLAARSDARKCEAVERAHPVALSRTPPSVVNSLVSRKRRQHAARCQRLAVAAMLAVQMPDTVELETEAAGGGFGSDGCGENGGEGGGASW